MVPEPRRGRHVRNKRFHLDDGFRGVPRPLRAKFRHRVRRTAKRRSRAEMDLLSTLLPALSYFARSWNVASTHVRANVVGVGRYLWGRWASRDPPQELIDTDASDKGRRRKGRRGSPTSEARASPSIERRTFPKPTHPRFESPTAFPEAPAQDARLEILRSGVDGGRRSGVVGTTRDAFSRSVFVIFKTIPILNFRGTCESHFAGIR